MKAVFRLSLPILAVAALTAAYNLFAHRITPQYPEDPRLSEFIFRSDEKPTVKGRADSVNVRWPNMEANETHLIIVYSSQTDFLPDKGLELWLTAVAIVPDETIQLLTEGAAIDTPLPGIHPYPYEYMPQGCKFTTIDPEFTDKTLAPDKEKIPRSFDPMDT